MRHDCSAGSLPHHKAGVLGLRMLIGFRPLEVSPVADEHLVTVEAKQLIEMAGQFDHRHLLSTKRLRFDVEEELFTDDVENMELFFAEVAFG